VYNIIQWSQFPWYSILRILFELTPLAQNYNKIHIRVKLYIMKCRLSFIQDSIYYIVLGMITTYDCTPSKPHWLVFSLYWAFNLPMQLWIAHSNHMDLSSNKLRLPKCYLKGHLKGYIPRSSQVSKKNRYQLLGGHYGTKLHHFKNKCLLFVRWK